MDVPPIRLYRLETDRDVIKPHITKILQRIGIDAMEETSDEN